MFKLQELPNGNVLVFYVSTGELAMIISNDKENIEAQSAKVVTRSISGNQLANVPLNEQYFPYVNLRKLPACKDVRVYEVDNVDGDQTYLKSNNSEEEKSSDHFHTQDSFLHLFGLQAKLQSGETSAECLSSAPVSSLASTFENTTRHKVINLNRFEFSSQLGRLVANRMLTKTTGETASFSQSQVQRYEFYCGDTRCLRSEGNFPVTYRLEDNHWEKPSEHKFCFNSYQRLERQRSLKYGLSTRSRWLLSRCRSCSLRLDKLPEAVIADWVGRKDPVKPKLVIRSDGCRETEVIVNGTVIVQLDDSEDESTAAASEVVNAGSSHLAEKHADCKHPYNSQLLPSACPQWVPVKSYNHPTITHLLKRSSDGTKKTSNGASVDQGRPWTAATPGTMVLSNMPALVAKKAKLSSDGGRDNFTRAITTGQLSHIASRPAKQSTAMCEKEIATSSDDDDVVCLGSKRGASNGTNGISECGRSNELGSVGVARNGSTAAKASPAAVTSALIKCFIPLEQRGVSVRLTSNFESASSIDNSHGNHIRTIDSGNNVDHAHLPNAREGVSMNGVTTSAGHSRSGPTSTASRPSTASASAKRCLFECLNCNTREEYVTNATRSIHDHILRCYTSFDKVSLVTNLDHFEQHGVIHVQAL